MSNNRELKKTLRKLEDDPNYQFKSQWHYERHMQARQDERDNANAMQGFELIVGVVVCVLIFFWLGANGMI
jgi:hypothetical protein